MNQTATDVQSEIQLEKERQTRKIEKKFNFYDEAMYQHYIATVESDYHEEGDYLKKIHMPYLINYLKNIKEIENSALFSLNKGLNALYEASKNESYSIKPVNLFLKMKELPTEKILIMGKESDYDKSTAQLISTAFTTKTPIEFLVKCVSFDKSSVVYGETQIIMNVIDPNGQLVLFFLFFSFLFFSFNIKVLAFFFFFN
jgi:hypothetical protein